MSTTHPTDIETEWDSLQRKYGNLPPKPPRETEEEKTKELVNSLESIDPLANKSLSQLNKLEDELEEDILNKYRQKRIQELKRKQKSYRFGEVIRINKSDFVKEVTEASAEDPYAAAAGGAAAGGAAAAATDDEDDDDYSDSEYRQQQRRQQRLLQQQQQQQQQQQKKKKGTYVVVHLTHEGLGVSAAIAAACKQLSAAFAAAAAANKDIKFIQGRIIDILPSFPSSSLPLILIYYGGLCIKQINGYKEWGGNHINQLSVENALRRFGVIEGLEDKSSSSSSSSDDSDEEKEKRRKEINNKGYSSTTLDRLLHRTNR